MRAKGNSKLKLVEAPPIDHMIAALLHEGWEPERIEAMSRDQVIGAAMALGWQHVPPTTDQAQAYPGTWHVRNPGDPAGPPAIGCRPHTVSSVLRLGGICRPYHRPPPIQPSPQQVAGVVASHLIQEIMKLPSIGNAVDREEVIKLVARFMPASENAETAPEVPDGTGS